MADGKVGPSVFPPLSANNIAIIFCYYETLMRSFTMKKKVAEVDRMKAMVPMMKECGFNGEFIDHVMGHAIGFLRDLPSFSKRAILTYLFNTEHTRAMNIVMWFKVCLPSRSSSIESLTALGSSLYSAIFSVTPIAMAWSRALVPRGGAKSALKP
jgi:hypothetical protein